MSKGLTTQVEETEEQFIARLTKGKAIVNRVCTTAKMSRAEQVGRLIELESARWFIENYTEMNDAQLGDYYSRFAKQIRNRGIKEQYWNN